MERLNIEPPTREQTLLWVNKCSGCHAPIILEAFKEKEDVERLMESNRFLAERVHELELEKELRGEQ